MRKKCHSPSSQLLRRDRSKQPNVLSELCQLPAILKYCKGRKTHWSLLMSHLHVISWEGWKHKGLINHQKKKLLKQDLDKTISPQTNNPNRAGNPRSTCCVMLAFHYCFILMFLRFFQFCSWVCSELPQAAALSTHLTLKPNPCFLMRHCSTSVFL